MKTEIERMSEADISEVHKLEIQENLAAWSIDGYKSELDNPDSICLVAKSNQKIAGFLIARLIMSNNLAEVYNIAVDSKHRRKKIGKLLIRTLENSCAYNNLDEIQLEVRVSNNAALAFYEALNFQIRHIRKNFYTNPVEDAFIMTKKLK